MLPSVELPNTFLAQAYALDDAWGPASGPCFAQPGPKATGEYWEYCDSKPGQGPVPYPKNPPDASPPSAPIQCNAPGNWLNHTAFVGGTYVAFGGNHTQDKAYKTGTVHANSSSISANATLPLDLRERHAAEARLRVLAVCVVFCDSLWLRAVVNLWRFLCAAADYQDRSGPAGAQCIMTTTLGSEYTSNPLLVI
jgi:hypothetical protein